MKLFFSSLLILAFWFAQNGNAQTTGYSIKTGSGMGFQKWNFGKRDPLLVYQGDIIIDSEGSGETKNSIYGSLGYHIRGGGLRINGFRDLNGNFFTGGNFGMRFYNACLEIGMKRFLNNNSFRPYYGMGARGEYTLKSKFDFQEGYKDFVRKFNYGISLRGGGEWQLKKLIALGFEVGVCPDISKQIFVPQGTKYLDYFTNTIQTSAGEAVRNLTIEFNIYIRFLHLIIYEE
ncbi:MAG TPA: hypothetical protein PK006_01275 [Saprospiraceae bacterium]|nr:hypothetical protein [Saprospiraceae bacterium]